MALVIDGYNLLHASGILPRGIGPGTLERARAALLNFLVESLEASELAKAVVVFDARAAPKGRPRLVTHRGLRIHFAPNPGDADALIEELILQCHSPRQLVVVSSDHRLQRAAKRRRAQAIDSDRWYAEVLRNRVGRQQQAADEAAKPVGPLSDHEVTHWLGRFGMTPADAIGSEPPISRRAGAAKPAAANPADDEKDAADSDADDSDSAGEKPPRRGTLANPFPPGYGEDLLEEE